MNSTLYVKRFDPTVTIDVTEDVTLPDYLPEVRRIVGVRANTSVDGKYLSGDALEADGGVTYTVLYTSGDGTLAQVSQTTSYTGHIPIKSDDDRFSPSDIVLSANLENVNCRVTAPRKLTLSSKVKLSALSQKPLDASLRLENPAGAVENTVRRRAADVPTAYMTEVRQNGEVSGEMREREGMSLIFAIGNLCLNDVRCDNQNRVIVKGDAYMTALLRSPEGAYVLSRSRAPIEEDIPLRDKQDSFGREASVIPAAFGKVVLIEIEGGDDGTLAWKMEYDIDCDLIHSTTAEITTDAYLPEHEDELTMADFRVCCPAGAVNGRLTTSAAMNLRPDCSYVCAWGSGVADKAELSGGRMTVGGSVKLCVVSVGNGEFFLDEVMIPLKYECEAFGDIGAAVPENLLGRMQVDVTEINARPDGNTLNLTAELAITAAMLAENTKTAAVTLTSAGETTAVKKNMIRVYIADADESAWDVEKKFKLGRDAVKEGNAYVV